MSGDRLETDPAAMEAMDHPIRTFRSVAESRRKAACHE